jgi:hypothetical protein
MSVQAINAALMSVPQILPKISNNDEKSGIDNFNSAANAASLFGGNANTPGLVLTSEYYSEDTMTLNYTSKDGDSVSLSTQSIEYQKAMLTANGVNSADDWKKIVDYMKDQFDSLKSQIIKDFLKSNGQDVQSTDQASGSEGIPGLPEYWNAENTSQRIVDFATSFYGAFKGSGDEFLSMIKDAIEKGFSQAKDIVGDLPDPVSKLVNNTHDLVMQKLDKWAADQGITDTQKQASAA